MYKLLTHQAYKANKSLSAGYYTPILYLAPSKLSGVDYCKYSSAGCRKDCLQYSGRMPMAAAARLRRSNLLNTQPDVFNQYLVQDIERAIKYSAKKGLQLAIRLNGTSDINFTDIWSHFPDVQFYDYTKNMLKVLCNQHPNLHLTFSRSEINEKQCLQVLGEGHNVAVVFGAELPSNYLGYPVIDGDIHDCRFLDDNPVIVGLRAKGRARKDKSSGFVVWSN